MVAHNSRKQTKLNIPDRKYPRGVFRNAKSNSFTATIRVNGKRVYLGSHKDVDDAARAYDQAAKTVYGKNAVLNFPDKPKGDAVDAAAEALGWTPFVAPSVLTPVDVGPGDALAVPTAAPMVSARPTTIAVDGKTHGAIIFVSNLFGVTKGAAARELIANGYDATVNPPTAVAGQVAEPELSREIITALADFALISIHTSDMPEGLFDRLFLDRCAMLIDQIESAETAITAYLGS